MAPMLRGLTVNAPLLETIANEIPTVPWGTMVKVCGEPLPTITLPKLSAVGETLKEDGV